MYIYELLNVEAFGTSFSFATLSAMPWTLQTYPHSHHVFMFSCCHMLTGSALLRLCWVFVCTTTPGYTLGPTPGPWPLPPMADDSLCCRFWRAKIKVQRRQSPVPPNHISTQLHPTAAFYANTFLGLFYIHQFDSIELRLIPQTSSFSLRLVSSRSATSSTIQVFQWLTPFEARTTALWKGPVPLKKYQSPIHQLKTGAVETPSHCRSFPILACVLQSLGQLREPCTSRTFQGTGQWLNGASSYLFHGRIGSRVTLVPIHGQLVCSHTF